MAVIVTMTSDIVDIISSCLNCNLHFSDSTIISFLDRVQPGYTHLNLLKRRFEWLSNFKIWLRIRVSCFMTRF